MDKDKVRQKLAQIKCHINNGVEYKGWQRFMLWWRGREDGGVQAWFDQLNRLNNELADMVMMTKYNFMGQLPMRMDEKEVIELMKEKEK